MGGRGNEVNSCSRLGLLCRNKKRGGLGIGRMGEKNKSLLAKWVWRFGKEEDTLWRKVVCTEYKVKPRSLI